MSDNKSRDLYIDLLMIRENLSWIKNDIYNATFEINYNKTHGKPFDDLINIIGHKCDVVGVICDKITDVINNLYYKDIHVNFDNTKSDF